MSIDKARHSVPVSSRVNFPGPYKRREWRQTTFATTFASSNLKQELEFVSARFCESITRFGRPRAKLPRLCHESALLMFGLSLPELTGIALICLPIILLIGVMLIAEGVGAHMDKGYIYFAMFFALIVEVINISLRGKAEEKIAENQAG